MATKVISGYAKHLEEDSMTLLVKQTELEPIKWEEADITKLIPASWYPGGIMQPENYRGPKIDYGDHFNGKEAIERWKELSRAEYWCSGEALEYGHDKDSNPLVRLVYGLQRGKSQWFPLHDAAKRWEKMRQEAERLYQRAVATAQQKDYDGPSGRQAVDEDSILIHPHEDKVPHRG